MEMFYMNYDQNVEISVDALIVAMWNKYIEYKGEDNKIFSNSKEFFENSFENAYDAAWAVSLSDKWNCTDDYVCFDEDGYLTSFVHWDDENSPIDPDKLDLSQLIDGLKNLKKWHKKRQGSIAIAIHDALK